MGWGVLFCSYFKLNEEQVDEVTDVINVGDTILVKYSNIDVKRTCGFFNIRCNGRLFNTLRIV